MNTQMHGGRPKTKNNEGGERERERQREAERCRSHKPPGWREAPGEDYTQQLCKIQQVSDTHTGSRYDL